MRPGHFSAIFRALFPALLLLSALLAVLLAAGPAAAQRGRPSGVMPLDQLLPEIRRGNPGEFYDADGPVPGADGQEHYHLKWMRPDGRIEWLDADARTGRLLGRSPGRDNFDGRPPAPGPAGRRNFAPSPSYPYAPDLYGSRRNFGGPPDAPPPGIWRRGGPDAYERDGGPPPGYGGGWRDRRDGR